ncbi:hypothetical protein [Hyphomicrobium sp.]|uniref:hypothetical protein n=1 Tax=Hyphomicrobium sp. TaxID=82 RepID=UPI002D7986CA|nr:hypothetical protein [Hyphomicrobium sp.]HET6389858.1 hypothetical protein [Hyphomicrobium sp.]
MKRNWIAGAGAALILASFVVPAAHAVSPAGLEAARAKARMGERLNPRERELLNKYGYSSHPRGHIRRGY